VSTTRLFEPPAEWTTLPQAPLGWMHSGVALVDGCIVVAHPAVPRLIFYDAAGAIQRVIDLEGLLEPHGFCVALGGGLWISDVGFKRRVVGPEFETARARGRVVRVDSAGRIVQELPAPSADWSPTSIAVVEERGELWVADGYGQSLVHRFDADGHLRQTLGGEEGAGRFNCPHGVIVDRRRGEGELYVSDRANARIQVFDLEGKFLRVAGEGVVVTPTDMTITGKLLALTDFTQSRVTVLDAEDQLVEHIGANPTAATRDGWPNARDRAGDLVRPTIEPGLFNSPHTLAADGDANVYVTEWLLGGRLTKLTRRLR
jgi:DNA-binding beta-propeller fold protein YncE